MHIAWSFATSLQVLRAQVDPFDNLRHEVVAEELVLHTTKLRKVHDLVQNRRKVSKKTLAAHLEVLKIGRLWKYSVVCNVLSIWHEWRIVEDLT